MIQNCFHSPTPIPPHNPPQLPVAMRTKSKSRCLAKKSLHGQDAAPISFSLYGHHVLVTLASFLLLKEHTNPFSFSARKTLLSALPVIGSFSCSTSQLRHHLPGGASLHCIREEFLWFASFIVLLIPL